MIEVLGISSLIGDSVSAASLTLSVPSSTLNLNIEPNNKFVQSETSNVKVKTDALAGYTLSIKSNSDNKLVNGETELNSISGKVSEADYQGEEYTNSWGYKPSKVNGAENSDFLPGPTAEESVIEQTNKSNGAENSYDITIGAKIDTSLPTGAYTNTFVFLASANSFHYTINYDLQEGTGGPAGSVQTDETTDATIKLDATEPKKEGYEFQGWCSVEPTSNNTASPSCAGTTYQSGGDYTFTDPISSSLTLWAVWKQTSIIDANCPGVVITDCEVNGTKGERYNGGPCWQSTDQGYSIQYNQGSCPSGWAKPSQSDFEDLVSDSQAGSGTCLHSRGWNGSYWSTDSNDSFCNSLNNVYCGTNCSLYYTYWGLSVESNSASVDSLNAYTLYYNNNSYCSGSRVHDNIYNSRNLRCLAR